MKTTSLTGKGQIVIPAEIRKRHGLKEGSKVMVTERGDQIVIIPVTRDYIQRMAGILSPESKVIEALLESRKKDKSKGK